MDAAQIDGDLALKFRIHGFGPEMAHQHIFGGNGDVGLKLKAPMAVCLAEVQKRALGALNAAFERFDAELLCDIVYNLDAPHRA